MYFVVSDVIMKCSNLFSVWILKIDEINPQLVTYASLFARSKLTQGEHFKPS